MKSFIALCTNDININYDMNGINYPNIQVTDDQVEAFRIWATYKYGNYMAYYEAIQSVEITQYIRINIISNELNHFLLQTDIYAGITCNNPHIKSLQIRRQSILIKMNCIKTMLGRRAFAQEVAVRRAHQEELFRQRSLRQHVISPSNNLTTRKIVQKKLTDDETQNSMSEDCVICLIKHNMAATCVIPCGHQFGSKCFARWKNNTCPLCRTPCMVVTEFVSDKQRRFFTDQETDTPSQVPKQVAYT